MGDPWIKYSEQRPDKVGVYEWRVPSVACPGLFVTVHDHMRVRGAGFVDVISPAFDSWDGYLVHVPEGLEWRPSTEFQDLKSYESSPAVPEGVDMDPCPFCGKVPEWASGQQSNSGGAVIGPKPQRLNHWRAKCCAWSASSSFSDPRDLAKARHSALTQFAKEVSK